MSVALVQFRAVVRKEVNQTLRDRRVMFMLIVAPLIQTLLLGYAVNFDVDRVPTVVADADASSTSRRHLRRLLADGTLLRVADADSPQQAEQLMDDGEAAAAVVVPSGFGADLLAERPASVQVVLDGTDPNRATVAAAAVSRYFGEQATEIARDLLRRRGGREPAALDVVPRVLYNPSLDTPPFMIPGIMAMLLVIVTTIVTAMGLSREREQGTLEQVLVTPIRPFHLLAGKMVPFVAIGLLDMMLVLTAGAFLFDVPMRGGLALLTSATLLYLMSTLGVGLFISTLSSTQQQSFLGGFLFILPAILLSGVMTPIRGMPEWLQPLTLINPLRYYVATIRSILLKAGTLHDLWPDLAALALFGAGILTVASLRFRKTLG